MNVSNAVERAYQRNSIRKHVTIDFPELGLTLGTDRLYGDSMRLSEALMKSGQVEFVGCISSKFSIQAHGITDDVKGKRMTVTIHTDGTEDEPITLFNGVVDSATAQSNQGYKKIVAYDELYTKGNVDCVEWYNALPYPVSMKEVRDSLFDYLGIVQAECDLPNDDVQITQMHDPAQLNAMNLIKSICQMNGAFGIMNREGKFEYRYVRQPETIPLATYKEVDYEEFLVKPVEQVVIRRNEDDAGTSHGDGRNKYVIQGNFFLYGLDEKTLEDVAGRLYEKVSGISYVPFQSDNNGVPYLECGDAASYEMMDLETQEVVSRQFLVMSRELSGIQMLFDSYGAEGEEFQSEFISDLGVQINAIKASYEELSSQKFVVYSYQNTSRLEVNSAEETEVIRISYSSMTDTVPVFLATIPFNTSLDGNVILRYYIDSVLYSQDTLQGYFPKGAHVLTASNYFSIKKNDRATVTVTLQMGYVESTERTRTADVASLLEFARTGTLPQRSVDATPPVATILPNTIRAVLFAHGLTSTGKWDGTITISETLAPIATGLLAVPLGAAMGLATREPIRAADIAERFPAIATGLLTLEGTSAAMTVDEVVEKYVFCTERKENYGYDAQYVSTEGSFRLEGSYSFQGTERPTPSGKLYAVAMDTGQFASVQSIRVTADGGGSYLVAAGGKYYDTAGTELDLTELTPEAFREYGSEAPPASTVLVAMDDPTVLLWTDGEGRTLGAEVTAVPLPQTVVSEPISLSHTSIHGIENATASCEGALVCAVSTDGETWRAHDGSEWIVLSGTNSGMSKERLEALTVDEWAAFLGTARSTYVRISLTDLEQEVSDVTMNFIN